MAGCDRDNSAVAIVAGSYVTIRPADGTVQINYLAGRCQANTLLAVLTALIILKMTDSDEPLVLTESLL